MIIERVEVYGINESIRASGYPKGNNDVSFERMERLGSCRPGTGHDCALKGMIVQADINAPQYWWLQFGRYHFADIVSSESKMHMILEMDLTGQSNRWVWQATILSLESAIKKHKENPTAESFQEIISNTPMGLMLKARITTNYLQLKTILIQRQNHKLEEWDVFCKWIEDLPEFRKLTKKGDK